MKNFLKVLFRSIFGPYEIYNIYQKDLTAAATSSSTRVVPVTADDLLRSTSPEIQALASYAGQDAAGFGIIDDGEVVCACWYWFGERYARDRGFWPLEKDEAKLVQITTAKYVRGRQLARKVIAASALAMGTSGFRRLFARVWHGHEASERAFKAAGWQKTGTVVNISLPLTQRQHRLYWPEKRGRRPAG